MATIYSQIEWRLEAAWISVLTTYMPSTVEVRRYNDFSTDVIYPCICVHCPGSESPENDIGTDQASINLICYTDCDKGNDETGSQLAEVLGQARDIVRTAGIETLLTSSVTALHVYKITKLKTEIPAIDADNRTRGAIITVDLMATCTDVLETEEEDEEYSSSSSSSEDI